MRKLKIALTLLFAMSLSLFLFACGGDPADNSKEGIKTVVVEVGKDAKVAYTDADTANSWTNAGITVKVNYTDASRESAVIPSDECDWDISAVKWGEVNTTLGYEIKVTPKDQPGTPVTGTYRVTIGHNWGTASQDGTSECGHCHAQMIERDVTDVIRYKAFHDGPFTEDASEDKYSKETTVLGEGGGTMMDGVKTITYGTIGIGQTFTLTGHAEVFRAEYMDRPGSDEANSHWFFPIMGVSIGNNSLLVRNDGWVLYDGIGDSGVNAPGRKLQGFFETGADGTNGKFDNEVVGDVVEENYNNGVVMPSDAIDWFPYMEGDLCRTADYEDGGADIELTWQFRTDNVMVISFNNIDAGKLMTMSFKVPTQSYNIILHGERVVMKLDHLSSISTLTNPVYRVDEVTKTDYAEGEMFDASTVKAFANYSQASNVPVAAAVYATLGTDTVDLSNTPLTPAMTDFRVVFAGQDPIALTGDKAINVVPSIVRGADGTAELTVGGQTFVGEKAQYAYGAADGKVVITATGIANSLTDEQKTALSTDKNFYISFRLTSTVENFEELFETLTGITATMDGSEFTAYAIDGESIGIVIPVNAEMIGKKITFAIAGVEGQSDIVLDLTDISVPAAASVISGKATIAGGGDITVVYKADAFKEDLSSNIRIYEGNNQLQGTAIVNGAKLGALTVKSVAQDKAAGTLTLVYTLPAADLANATLSYNIRLRIGSDYVNDTIYYAPEVGTPATDAKGVAIATDGIGSVYAQAAGDKLLLLIPYDKAYAADPAVQLKLNVNAGAATISAEKSANAKDYNLSYKLTRAGEISFINASDALAASENTSIEYVVLGEDGVNRGAYVLITADVSVAEVRSEDATQEYYFELNPKAVEAGTARSIYKVGAKIEEVSVTPTAADKVDIVSGDCTEGSVQGISAYAYKGEGTTVLFYYGIKVTAAGHNWEGTGVQTCSKCGSIKKDGDIMNTAVAKIESALTDGISVSFLSYIKEEKKATETLNNDWLSESISAGKLNICLPNLDSWGASGDLASTNKFTPDEFTNGGAWNSFLATKAYLTITVDMTNGIRFYKNGELVITYTKDGVYGSVTNGDFIEALLTEIAAHGLTVAKGRAFATAEDMFIHNHALDANGAKSQYDLYIAEHGEIVIPKEDPAYSNRQTMNAEQPVNLGKGAVPTWLTPLAKGDKLEFEGAITSEAAEAWHALNMYVWSSTAPKGILRTDDFIYGKEALEEFEHWAITSSITGADVKEVINGDSTFKVTYDWSENDNKITVTLVITNKTDTTKVYTHVYTIVPNVDYPAFDENHYSVGMSADEGSTSVSLTKFVKNGTAQEPAAPLAFQHDSYQIGLGGEHVYIVGSDGTNDVTVGTEDKTLGFTGNNPVWTSTLNKGEKVTVTGTMISKATQNHETVIVNIRTDNTTDGCFRGDNWIVGHDDKAQAMGNSEKWDIAKNTTVVDWADYREVIADCNLTVTWDWTQSNTKIVITIVVAQKTDGGKSFTQTYTLTPQ